MCGIVGLFLKTRALEPELGGWLRTMLIELSERGPDSTGFAIYGTPAPAGMVKLTLFHADPHFSWTRLGEDLGAKIGAAVSVAQRANHALFVVPGGESAAKTWFKQHHPELRIVGAGTRMEIFKDVGSPVAVADKFALAEMAGSHAIGHTRMATESVVSTEGSHPFAAGDDVCVVHNGSLSNHNRLRQWLRRHGQDFDTLNDTEVAARYFAYHLGEGASLDEAICTGFADLDGFYSFVVGTRDGFAVVRDGFACKPAVLAETDGWVAIASEYRSIAGLPGSETATIWEPKPKRVYSWHLDDPTPAAEAA